MAAPSGTTWGSIAGGYGRIGIYIGLSSTATQTTVTISTWFWSKYSVSDTNNSYYYNNYATSATTKIGSINLNTTNDSGSGWSTSNQVKLGQATYTYDRGTSDKTYACAIKLTDVDRVGAQMTHTRSYTIPKLASYTVTYKANGGTGTVPTVQTRYHNQAAVTIKSASTLSRSGYSFSKWNTKADGSGTNYNAGAKYSTNANLVLYAQWTINTWKVNYYPNATGVTNMPSSQTKTYNVNLPLSSTIPKRDNYTFLGWSTSLTATTPTYKAGVTNTYTGNAALNLYAVWSLAYKKPTIGGFSVSRCTSDGKPADDGTYAKVVFNWTAYYSTNKIVISCVSSVNTVSKTINNTGVTSGSISEIIGGESGSSNALSADSPYTIRVTISDSGGQVTSSREIPGSMLAIDVLIDPEKGPQGISFGGPATEKDFANFAFSTRHRKNVHFENGVGIIGKSPDGSEASILIPSTADGDTYIASGNFSKQYGGNTAIFGRDIYFHVGSTDTRGVLPYWRKGNNTEIIIETAGFVTNAGKDVHFAIPLARPIYGSPAISLASTNGFILRQGSKYTHGSTAEQWVSPTSLKPAYMHSYYGFSVVATFADTTNVTNNDAIGIVWRGTITFS